MPGIKLSESRNKENKKKVTKAKNEDMIYHDHRSYTHNLSSCEIKA